MIFLVSCTWAYEGTWGATYNMYLGRPGAAYSHPIENNGCPINRSGLWGSCTQHPGSPGEKIHLILHCMWPCTHPHVHETKKSQMGICKNLNLRSQAVITVQPHLLGRAGCAVFPLFILSLSDQKMSECQVMRPSKRRINPTKNIPEKNYCMFMGFC